MEVGKLIQFSLSIIVFCVRSANAAYTQSLAGDASFAFVARLSR